MDLKGIEDEKNIFNLIGFFGLHFRLYRGVQDTR